MGRKRKADKMIHRMVSLDAETDKLARQKGNFSAWVRGQLRSERNKMTKVDKYCKVCDTTQNTSSKLCMNKMCKEYLFEELEVLP